MSDYDPDDWEEDDQEDPDDDDERGMFLSIDDNGVIQEYDPKKYIEVEKEDMMLIKEFLDREDINILFTEYLKSKGKGDKT